MLNYRENKSAIVFDLADFYFKDNWLLEFYNSSRTGEFSLCIGVNIPFDEFEDRKLILEMAIERDTEWKPEIRKVSCGRFR